MKPPPLPRAPAARIKLQAAEATKADLVFQRDALALAAFEQRPGADKALATHRMRIEAVERDVAEMRGAAMLAERLDREAEAVAAAEMRGQQLAVFEKASAARITAMTDVLAAITKATAAYGHYARASQEMAASLPTGTHLPVMSFGGDGHFLGNGEALISREAFRVAGEGAKPPFAKLPPLSMGDDVSKMRPALEILRDAHETVLREIRGQVEKLDREALESAGRTQAA